VIPKNPFARFLPLAGSTAGNAMQSIEIASEANVPATARRTKRLARIGGLIFALTAVCLSGCCHIPGGRLRDWWTQNCKVGPNYARPAAAIANDWIDANDPRLRKESVNYAYWWRQFNDPYLDNLVQTASAQNLTLRAAGFRILEARARRQIAVGNLFPQLQQATFDYQRFNLSQRTANFPPNVDFDEFDLGFDLAWELDLWGRFRRAVEEQDARLDASIEDYDDFLVILQAEVALTYVQIRTLQQRIVYARQNADTQKSIFDLAGIRFQEGAVSNLDVQQSENIWRTTAAAIPSLEASLRQSQNALAVLLGIPPRDMTQQLGGPAPVPVSSAEVVVGIPADILRRRPDVRRAERLVAAQSARIGIAVSDLYPSVTILGSLGWNAEDFGDLFNSDAFRGNVGPSIRWNILNYGRIRNNVVAQDARLQELIALYEQTVLEANAEAENAIVGYLRAIETLREAQAAERAAREALTLATGQYREGLTDYSRVLLATGFLTDSQDRLALAQPGVATNLIQLYRALGGGWESRLTTPNLAMVGPRPAAMENLPQGQQAPAPTDLILPPQ
jgi:NodT family efflux transporter outer membrane factor (OMF) lipoprotein